MESSGVNLINGAEIGFSFFYSPFPTKEFHLLFVLLFRTEQRAEQSGKFVFIGWGDGCKWCSFFDSRNSCT